MLNSALYILRQSIYMLRSNNLKLIYYALFQSHLQYGNLLWSNTKKSNLNYLTKLQTKTIKSINHCNRTLSNELNMLNIDQLKQSSLCKFMQRLSIPETPQNLKSLFTLNNEIHPYNTRHANVPHITKANCAIFQNSFIFQAPLKWIDLPVHLKLASKSAFPKN